MKSAKRKSVISIIRGKDPISTLYRAVARYVESNGGRLVVIGGIQIQRWPSEEEFSFSVAVKCIGFIDEKEIVMKPMKARKVKRAKGNK